jgi:predicted dinucleotide-utilizing enzyme
VSDALKVALLGCGVVGSEVVRLLDDQADDLAARIGAPLELTGIAVRRPARHTDVPADLLTTDAAALVARDDVDLVVEVVGGIEPVRTLLLDALRTGKSVVSANKALLAEDGATLHDAAARAGVDLYYEAAVAGAIPLLRPLRESLAGDRITRPVPDSTKPSPRRPHSDTQRPIRRQTSTGSTQLPRRPYLPASRSTPGSRSPTCTGRASLTSPPPTWQARTR